MKKPSKANRAIRNQWFRTTGKFKGKPVPRERQVGVKEFVDIAIKLQEAKKKNETP